MQICAFHPTFRPNSPQPSGTDFRALPGFKGKKQRDRMQLLGFSLGGSIEDVEIPGVFSFKGICLCMCFGFIVTFQPTALWLRFGIFLVDFKSYFFFALLFSYKTVGFLEFCKGTHFCLICCHFFSD